MRNNDWTRAFLRAILDAGEDIDASTAVQGKVIQGFCDRAYDCRASDQSTIVYLLSTEPDKWRNQTLLEKRFTLNGHWRVASLARAQHLAGLASFDLCLCVGVRCLCARAGLSTRATW